MKGDFSRDTFDARRGFLRVMQQQGRVLLDSDWNEQTSILLHLLQSMARDWIGPHRCFDGGFLVEPAGDVGDPLNRQLSIRAGHCYVNGLLCENSMKRTFAELGEHQHSLALSLLQDSAFLLYLDVWERHITCAEDSRVREKALNGPDTASRSKLVWQVRRAELILIRNRRWRI